MRRPSLPASLRRPSPAVVISVIALLFALSGTAVAATGSDLFLLGKSNHATKTTSLSDSKGTALSLSSTSSTPPLRISNSVQVPNLNASYLGGKGPSAYMAGDGQVAHNTSTFNFGEGSGVGLAGAGADYELLCNSNGTAQSILTVLNNNSQVWWLNKDGNGYGALSADQTVDLTPATGNPYTIVVQVVWDSNVVTFDVSQAVNTSARTCTYAVQSVSNG
jgi:predicted heme/steroid binding protein